MRDATPNTTELRSGWYYRLPGYQLWKFLENVSMASDAPAAIRNLVNEDSYEGAARVGKIFNFGYDIRDAFYHRSALVERQGTYGNVDLG